MQGIKLKEETRQRLIDGIIRFFDEERGEHIGVLAAELYLDYFMENLAPIIYNAAVDDTEAFLMRKMEDLVLLKADID